MKQNYISALEICFIPYKQHRLSVYLNLHHRLKCGLQQIQHWHWVRRIFANNIANTKDYCKQYMHVFKDFNK
jgi:hypothetical protein